MLAPMVPKGDGRTVKPEPKRVDPHYRTEAHERWRDQVLTRAGYQCQWIEDGHRCSKSAPRHRLFADHIRERSDGGDPFDPDNGQCLCGSHHTRKTAMARTVRTRG